ncbi:MAG TPA: hypothetical protein VGM56_02385 [Byssovorax sp.]
MTDWKRWRGLASLVEDAVEHGSRAIERVHRETAKRPFDLLEQIPVVAPPTRVVRVVHDAIVTLSYGGVRAVNRVVGAGVGLAIATGERGVGAIDGAAKADHDAPRDGEVEPDAASVQRDPEAT